MTTPTWQDSFGRQVSYLRISLTDRCNFRCLYCMPAEGDPFASNPDLLTFEEIEAIARIFVSGGVRKIRLTGGEPLVRAKVPELVERLNAIPGLEHIALTTNAFLLKRHAQALHEAGLSSINISLDSLDAKKFEQLTRIGSLSRVLEGIDAALTAGIHNIKLNAVVIRGFNDDELTELIKFSAQRNIIMRFIEFMPIGNQTIWGQSGVKTFVSAEEIRAQLAQTFTLESEAKLYGAGPSRYWRAFGEGLPTTGHPIGIISAVTECFCDDCNRVRLTSKGGLRACLADDHEHNLRDILRSDEPLEVREQKLLHSISKSLGAKKESHAFDLSSGGVTLKAMNAIGG